MNNFEFSSLNLGKLPNFVRYFGSNTVEGVAESWVEAEMSWVEVDGAGWRWVHGLVIPINQLFLKCFCEFINITASCSKLAFKIRYLIRFVFDCTVAVNFRSEIQINRIFGIWI